MCQWEYKVILVSQSPIGRVNLSEQLMAEHNADGTHGSQSPIRRVNLSEFLNVTREY